MVRLNPPLKQNYSIFMRNFQKNQHKISNYQVQVSNNPLYKFTPLARTLDPLRLLLVILFYLHGPAHMGPIWNRLHYPYWCPHGSYIDKIASWARAGLFLILFIITVLLHTLSI